MWYYINNGERQGPINNNDVKTYIQDGIIKEDTKVWRKGMQDWKSAIETDLSNKFSLSRQSRSDKIENNDTSISSQNQNINVTINTIKLLFENPIGNLNIAFENLLSRRQILVVSLIIIILTSILSVWGIREIIKSYFGIFYEPDIFMLIKTSLIIPASVFVISVFICSVMKQYFNYEGELFITSIFNIPIGLFLILSSIFTIKNIDVIIVLFAFFFIISILILFNGFVKVIKLSERAAAYSIPVTLLLSAWFVTVLFRAIIL